MKKIIPIIVCILICKVSFAADVVTFTIADGIENSNIKSKMEATVSRILTEANAAQESGREMNYSSLGIAADVQSSLAMLWDNSPFICMDTEIVEHCITTGAGYQIRNIPLLMKPRNEGDLTDDEYQEAVISFDKSGNLSSFHIAISMNLYMNVIKSNMELTDLRRRQLILDYVEQFRTSYNQKDLNFLEAVFSDDALIITGKVIQRKTGDGVRLPDKIEYTKNNKKEYMNKLRNIFRANKRIHITFDEIEVMRHPVNKDFYGVTLKQGWSTDRYHDDGYLFLLWDFRDESHPQIHVRTWQPDQFNGSKLPKDEIFSLSDFDI